MQIIKRNNLSFRFTFFSIRRFDIPNKHIARTKLFSGCWWCKLFTRWISIRLVKLQTRELELQIAFIAYLVMFIFNLLAMKNKNQVTFCILQLLWFLSYALYIVESSATKEIDKIWIVKECQKMEGPRGATFSLVCYVKYFSARCCRCNRLRCPSQ